MTNFFAILWNIFAFIGIACIATTLGCLLVLWLSSRRQQRHWARLQEPQSHPPFPSFSSVYRPQEEPTIGELREFVRDGGYSVPRRTPNNEGRYYRIAPNNSGRRF